MLFNNNSKKKPSFSHYTFQIIVANTQYYDHSCRNLLPMGAFPHGKHGLPRSAGRFPPQAASGHDQHRGLGAHPEGVLRHPHRRGALPCPADLRQYCQEKVHHKSLGHILQERGLLFSRRTGPVVLFHFWKNNAVPGIPRFGSGRDVIGPGSPSLPQVDLQIMLRHI